MREIKIFLASSVEEFQDERRELQDYIDDLNKEIFLPVHIYINFRLCEDFSNAMAIGRKQDEYNDVIQSSEYFYVLIGKNAGQYTVEEFNVAWKQFRASGSPKIYTYFKKLPEGRKEDKSVESFKKLLHGHGHYFSWFQDLKPIKDGIRKELLKDLLEDRPVNSSYRTAKQCGNRKWLEKMVAESVSTGSRVGAKNILRDASWERKLEDAEKHLAGYAGSPDAAREERKARHSLAAKNPEAYAADLAKSCRALYDGSGYGNKEQRMEGLKLCREALEIYQGLAVKNPEKYGEYVEDIYDKLNFHLDTAENYKGKDEQIQALRLMLKASRILVAWKPESHESDLAIDCSELGCLLSDGNKEEKEEAEQLYRESIKIRRKLGQKDVCAAQTCRNFGRLLDSCGRREEARQFYGEALEIYQRLEMLKPGRYEKDLAYLCKISGLC